MKSYTLAEIKLGSAHGAPRVWLEGKKIESAGFTPGKRYQLALGDQRVTLTLCDDGTRVVSGKQKGDTALPVIDINSAQALGMFAGMERLRVVITHDAIHLLPLATQKKAAERLRRIESAIASGEELRVGSFCHGGGVLSNALCEGFKRAGVKSKLVFANDIDEDVLMHAAQVNPVWESSTMAIAAPLQEVVADNWLVKQLGPLHCVEGGLPCVGASVAGRAKKKLEMAEADPNAGHLVVPFLALIEQLQPAIVILENVVPYLSTASAYMLRYTLKDWGYTVHETVLEAGEFGCLENRKRMAMVAVTAGLSFDIESIEKPALQTQTLGDILEDVPHDAACWSSMNYLREKEARRRLLEAAFENQQKMIRETERFVERFRAKNTKARQVQSRLRRLEKVDRIELETDEQEIAFRFPPPPRSGRVVLRLDNVDKRYGDTAVFEGVSLTVERGDRIAVLGVNGAGKSTLARLLAGIEPIQGGRRIEGHQVTVSYYAQNQADALDPSRTVLESVEEVAAFGAGGNLRTLLGHFLFSDDDVFKRVSVLSGGEKSRLALARMLLVPANFLVLDEPTNHLDMRSKEVLKEALRAFDGTFVIVSHDRDFLSGLVTKVLVAKDRGLVLYPGSVDDYLRIWRAREGQAPGGEPRREPDPGASRTQRERERRRGEAERRQERYRRVKPLKEDLEALLNEIDGREKRKAELETLLADPATYGDGSRAKRLGAEYRDLAPQLEDLYRRWGDLQGKIDAIEQGEREG
mgnify:CR=1 FL=1